MMEQALAHSVKVGVWNRHERNGALVAHSCGEEITGRLSAALSYISYSLAYVILISFIGNYFARLI